MTAPVLDVALRRALPGFALDVSFTSVERVTSLFGRSGSGKTMTLGLIAGLARPDFGHVRVGEASLLDTAARRILPVHHRRIGLVFQDAQLFPHLTVGQNLRFGRWFARSGPEPSVGFDAVVDTLGIAALLDRRPGALSGGEKQRVAIGRALLARPRLLLFDEPLAALDRPRRLEILPLIERLRDEFAVPIVYVSHALEEVVRLGGHVVVMEGGRVAAAGAPEVVLGAARIADDARTEGASVLAVTIGAYDDAFGLTALHHPAGTLWLSGRIEPAGRPASILVRAADVGLALGDPGSLSIQSTLRGTVDALASSQATTLVTVALEGGGRIGAMVTRRATHDLALRIGTPVRALIKTAALDQSRM